ncbi:MAG: endonuclease/exonuclease/phosphatase [Ignavibacteria bacterium]|nr:MAG: endonuclease/exonuclease/phosphatase [Ignavibacteria bacterium]
MKKVYQLILFVLLSCSLFAQEQIRVMSYNLLNYPNTRDQHFKKIISTINPDALVVVEMIQQVGVNQFLTNVLGTDYAAATVAIKGTNGAGNDGNDCAFYYKPSILTLVETKTISARTRVISEFKLVHNVAKDTITIFGVHLKAFPEDTVKRSEAVTSFRNRTLSLNKNANYLVCGDFNIFSSNEPAFKKLVDKSTTGYVIDMMNVTGYWSDSPVFNSVCTHSSTDLDTRLDMILISQGLQDKGGVDYVDNSFKIFGNDGNHFNKAVNNGSNAWFPNDVSIGTSLVAASDHLPIYADFAVGVPTGIEKKKTLPENFELLQNYPNPFNPETTISYKLQATGSVSLKIFNLLGGVVATPVNKFQQAGEYNVQLSTNNYQLSSGIYFYQLKVGNFVQTKKMVVLK